MDDILSSPRLHRPKVSVVLTSYNHAQFLKKSIESILGQTFSDFELFIIDDASIDESPGIIQNYASRDPRIRPILHEQNIYEQNCNLPLYMEQMTGEYIAIAHSDDAWMPNKLRKQVDYLEANVDIAACFTWVTPIDDEGNLFSDSNHFYATAFTHKNRSRFEWLHHFFFKGCPLCHPSLLIRKNAYVDYGLFTIGLNSIPDFCKWIRLCLHADIHVIEEKLTLFRVHADESNTSGDTYSNRCRTLVEDYLVLKEFFAIEDPDVFLKIFPEAQAFCLNGEIIIPFALAQMGLLGSWKMHKLFALECIYNLLQNPQTADRIRTLYGYGEKEFNLEKTKHDIFGEIPSSRIARSSLIINYSVSEGDCEQFEQVYYVSNLGIGLVSWDLSVLCTKKDRTPESIIFIPDNHFRRRITILHASIDSETLIFSACNKDSEIGEWDVFSSSSPKYVAHTLTACSGVLTIRLKAFALCVEELTNFIDDLQSDIANIKSSTSWKITAPMRRFMDALRNARETRSAKRKNEQLKGFK